MSVRQHDIGAWNLGRRSRYPCKFLGINGITTGTLPSMRCGFKRCISPALFLVLSASRPQDYYSRVAAPKDWTCYVGLETLLYMLFSLCRFLKPSFRWLATISNPEMKLRYVSSSQSRTFLHDAYLFPRTSLDCVPPSSILVKRKPQPVSA